MIENQKSVLYITDILRQSKNPQEVGEYFMGEVGLVQHIIKSPEGQGRCLSATGNGEAFVVSLGGVTRMNDRYFQLSVFCEDDREDSCGLNLAEVDFETFKKAFLLQVAEEFAPVLKAVPMQERAIVTTDGRVIVVYQEDFEVRLIFPDGDESMAIAVQDHEEHDPHYTLMYQGGSVQFDDFPIAQWLFGLTNETNLSAGYSKYSADGVVTEEKVSRL